MHCDSSNDLKNLLHKFSILQILSKDQGGETPGWGGVVVVGEVT